MKWLCLLGLFVVVPLRDAAACVRPADGLEPHVLDAGHVNDTTPPAAPTVTYSVSRNEIDGGCGTTTDCDGKYGNIFVSIVASDDAAPAERLGYLVRVVGGGDVPRELIAPWHDSDARQQPQGELTYGFDYDDNSFDFELEVRVVDLNGNISAPTIMRIADEQASGGCSTAGAPGWWVLAALALVLRRRR